MAYLDYDGLKLYDTNIKNYIHKANNIQKSITVSSWYKNYGMTMIEPLSEETYSTGCYGCIAIPSETVTKSDLVDGAIFQITFTNSPASSFDYWNFADNTYFHLAIGYKASQADEFEGLDAYPVVDISKSVLAAGTNYYIYTKGGSLNFLCGDGILQDARCSHNGNIYTEQGGRIQSYHYGEYLERCLSISDGTLDVTSDYGEFYFSGGNSDDDLHLYASDNESYVSKLSAKGMYIGRTTEPDNDLSITNSGTVVSSGNGRYVAHYYASRLDITDNNTPLTTSIFGDSVIIGPSGTESTPETTLSEDGVEIIDGVNSYTASFNKRGFTTSYPTGTFNLTDGAISTTYDNTFYSEIGATGLRFTFDTAKYDAGLSVGHGDGNGWAFYTTDNEESGQQKAELCSDYIKIGIETDVNGDGSKMVYGETRISTGGLYITGETHEAGNHVTDTDISLTASGLDLGHTNISNANTINASNISGTYVKAGTAFQAYTSVASTTYGVGTNGQVLTSNGSRSYWATPSNAIYSTKNTSTSTLYPLLARGVARTTTTSGKYTSQFSPDIYIAPGAGTLYATYIKSGWLFEGTSENRHVFRFSAYKNGSSYVYQYVDEAVSTSVKSGNMYFTNASDIYGVYQVSFGTMTSAGLFSSTHTEVIILGWSTYKHVIPFIGTDHVIDSVAATTYRNHGFSLSYNGSTARYEFSIAGDAYIYNSSSTYRPAVQFVKLNDINMG